jgi:hypothetical protein
LNNVDASARQMDGVRLADGIDEHRVQIAAMQQDRGKP